MIVKALAGVAHDLLKGARFYEQQEPGLGHEFRLSVLSDISALKRTGGIHGQLQGFHHVVCSRFDSYVIFYRVQDQTVIVKAVMDGRRDPMRQVRRLRRYR
ncbi:MAG: hypothetical protein JWO94_452 [Verrucomicrobiaceae bacterium]|nr:hypothetical protein [Verrucomicrobiaceae bacterium]